MHHFISFSNIPIYVPGLRQWCPTLTTEIHLSLGDNSACRLHSPFPAVAEAAALLHGIIVAVDMGYNFVIFEGDYALVLNGLKGPIDLLGRDVSSLILNCRKMIKRIDMWDVSLVPRTADWEAHNLVK